MAEQTTDSVATQRYPDWLENSSKQRELDRVLLDRTEGPVNTLLQHLTSDAVMHQYHSYANVVSVRRLGYNDHGPVHARIVTYNALKILRLLHEAEVATSLEDEEVGRYEDSQVAVALAGFLHDIGMGVARTDHEWHSMILADRQIRSCLEHVYPDEHDPMRPVLHALTHEAIVGHMASQRIHSMEAGVVLVADGCDMAHGRARIPQALERDPMVGDIHRFSASAIRRVDIQRGESKPVSIKVTMDNVTGLFQVEEILMTKVKASPIMPHLEVTAIVGDEEPRQYLA
ncbi:MAG: phosphohydrolase [Bacteroidetes bacterium]|jgi:metal-dependent HD superfamily phosphatase/phosphodiesterase|nr:phosphohydrolase [Bacteroidota bacterium]